MSTLIAISFDNEASPGFTIRRDSSPKAMTGQFGWGFGWYPNDDETAVVLKNPDSSEQDAMSGLLREWERFRSSSFVCHLRGSTKKALQRDAQPFLKSYAGRHWIFAHNGDLRDDFRESFSLGVNPVFEPIGKTDSEHLVCWLLTLLRTEGARTLEEYGWENLVTMFDQVNDLGSANMVFTDGRHIIVRSDRNDFNPLYWLRRVPPHATEEMHFDELVIALTGSLDRNRTMSIISNAPQSDEPWIRMLPGQTLVLRGGAVVWNSAPNQQVENSSPGVGSFAGSRQLDAQQAAVSTSPQGSVVSTDPALTRPIVQVGDSVSVHAPGTQSAPGVSPLPSERILSVTHETNYKYTGPVEHSAHVYRLRPVHDDYQSVIEHSLLHSVDGPSKDFEDVFGNHSRYVELSMPYSELTIAARSVIRVLEPPPLAGRSSARRDTLPLVWMPWQRQMMSPYLLPVELPETELQELNEFALSIAARNDNDLNCTVLELNETIYRDFAYVSGSTTLETTPYDVFVSRQGVCQDFANLMICLARLLGLPARYRVGYIFTGSNYENKIQSEASHAWAELYLPWNGWRGFDPTNGCIAGVDHVRVACGRNYRDATPTAGTIYKGDTGTETLTVDVRVEELSPDELAS